MTEFQKKVARAIKKIPRGMTVSYGEIALRAGKPQGARAVVSALRSIDDVPWWRVARADGTLAPQVAGVQAQMLRQEGWRPKNRISRKKSVSTRRRKKR